jgi:hypothetical protein
MSTPINIVTTTTTVTTTSSGAEDHRRGGDACGWSRVGGAETGGTLELTDMASFGAHTPAGMPGDLRCPPREGARATAVSAPGRCRSRLTRTAAISADAENEAGGQR